MAFPDAAKPATAETVNGRRNFEQLAGQLNSQTNVYPSEPQGPDQHAIELRGYQRDVIKEFDGKVAAGSKRVLLVAPTASGKTVILADIVRRAKEQGRSVVVLAHRREIIQQTFDELRDRGVRAGIIQAGISGRPLERVQVASISTLWCRAFRSDAMPRPDADLFVIDEAHHATARSYRKIIEAYPNAILLGLTATPCRGDGRGLGNTFDVMIECPQVAELTAQGYLVNAVVYAPLDPDLSGVATRNGDYSEDQLAERVDQPKLVGDIIMHWHKFGKRRKTVVFAVNVEHSLHLRDEFCRSGVRAEHVDGNTAAAERDAILARLASGETELVTNCMVLTEGWNMPEVACCILARPTKKLGLYRQMVGRVLRTAPGKTDAVILDHAGAVYRHGQPADHVNWSLDPDSRAVSPAHEARKQKKIGGGLIECTQCTALRVGGQACMQCGFEPVRQGKYVEIEEGDLRLVTNGKAGAAPTPTEQQRITFYSELRSIERERGFKRGWAAHQYNKKFSAFPPWEWNNFPNLTPTAMTRSWVRSRQIAFAKRRTAAC
jgi:DNA repair protein RadD